MPARPLPKPQPARTIELWGLLRPALANVPQGRGA